MTTNFNRQIKKQFFLILSSLALEYYQFTLFIVLSHKISQDLLPMVAIEWRHWFSLTIFILAGVCRPLGGMLFSNIGDSNSRTNIFYWVMLTMSVTSVILGVLPNYARIGVAAPIILIILRIVQGVLVGAAIPEALIYFYEKAAVNRRLLATTLLNVAIGLGYLLAIIFSVFSFRLFNGESWRYGLIGCGLLSLLIGIGLRNSFYRELPPKIPAYTSLWTVASNYKLVVLRLICFATFLTSGTAVFFYVMPSFLRDYYHYSEFQSDLSGIVVVASFLLGLSMAIWFHLRMGKSFYISTGFVFKALLVLVFHSYVSHSLMEITLLNSICCFIFGFFMGKLPVMMISSFPKNLRYAGVSTVYNLSFGLMFAVSHYLVLWLIHITHSLYMPSMYIIFFSYVSLISLWFMSNETFFAYQQAD